MRSRGRGPPFAVARSSRTSQVGCRAAPTPSLAARAAGITPSAEARPPQPWAWAAVRRGPAEESATPAPSCGCARPCRPLRVRARRATTTRRSLSSTSRGRRAAPLCGASIVRPPPARARRPPADGYRAAPTPALAARAAGIATSAEARPRQPWAWAAMLRGPVAEPHPHPVLAARVRVGRFEARLHRGVPARHRDADASTRSRLGLLQAGAAGVGWCNDLDVDATLVDVEVVALMHSRPPPCCLPVVPPPSSSSGSGSGGTDERSTSPAVLPTSICVHTAVLLRGCILV